MNEASVKPHFKSWRTWFSPLGYDSRERRYWRGERDIGMARGFTLLAVACFVLADVALSSHDFRHGYEPSGYWRLTVAMGMFVLGIHVWRGKAWASLGLMALYTADRGYCGLIAFEQGYIIDYIRISADHMSLWAVEWLVSWLIWMRVCFLSFESAREQSATTAGPAASPSAGH